MTDAIVFLYGLAVGIAFTFAAQVVLRRVVAPRMAANLSRAARRRRARRIAKGIL
jgi:hypothetical protein